MASFSVRRTSVSMTFQNMIKIVIPLGCMSPAAIASPILFEYQALWLTTVLVFFLSTGIFVGQHLDEMQTYGPFTLVFATFLGFAAYSSARTPLPDLVPWIPMVVWLFVLLTVYFLPKAHGICTRPIDHYTAMEEGRGYHFRRFPVENQRGEIDSRNHLRNDSLELSGWRSHDVTGMDHRSALELLEGLSTHESDIDLQEHSEAAAVALRRVVSMSRAGLFSTGLSQSSSDGPYNQTLTASVHGGHFRPSGDSLGSPSLDSVAVSVPMSAEESEMPLLG
ncbi:hypothetical protein EG329_002815 [Mollisiaceae sp. DMI_Dod_QoI]|nr:hypothetical protein EG329_002815 [Helotiales sp. DMI_Dod_QoI]